MVYIARHTVYATCTASGGVAHTFQTGSVISGHVEAIVYRRGSTAATTSGISTGAKIVITAAQTGLPILTIATASADSMVFYPRAFTQDASGAQLGTVAASSVIPTLIPVGQEPIKIVVTSGGPTSNAGPRGVFDFYISGQ